MTDVEADTNLLAVADAPHATQDERASPLGQFAWAFFEFARNPYVSMVYIFVFAPYFANTVVGDPIRGQELWSLINTIQAFIIGAAAPILGAIADRAGPRKPWIAAMTVIIVPACCALWYALPNAHGGLSIAVIAMLLVTVAACFDIGSVFHSAMLASIVPATRIGWLSGVCLGVGNISTMIVLIVMLFGVAMPANGVHLPFVPDKPLFGIDPATYEHMRVAGPLAGIWMAVFALPMFLLTPDRRKRGLAAGVAVREGFVQLWTTARAARTMKNVGLYLVARMFYSDGLGAILAYSGIYATAAFHWDLTALLLFGALLTPFSVSSGFVAGWLDHMVGSKRAIIIGIGLAAVGMIGTVAITPHEIFFMPYEGPPLWSFPYFNTVPELVFFVMYAIITLAVGIGISCSRAMMARIAPLSMMSQFFGIMALSGTATAFLGHGLVSLATTLSQSQRVGFSAIILLLVAGFVPMFWVREERTPEP
jgi:UMF1 family MFS transporter